jgi:anti-sigma factor RsiW
MTMNSAQPPIDDVMLMAWADGQADAVQTRLVEEAIATNPELAKRAAAMTLSRAYLQQARNEHPVSQVSDDLLKSVQAMVYRHEQAQAPRRLQPSLWATVTKWFTTGLPAGPAFAALALSLGVGLMLGQNTSSPPLASGPPSPSAAGVSSIPAVGQPMPSAVAAALSNVRSGVRVPLAEAGGAMAVVASYGQAAAVCREFLLERPSQPGLEVLACRTADGPWTTQIVGLTPEAGDQFRAASGDRPIDSAVRAKGLGPALNDRQEQALGFTAERFEGSTPTRSN